MRRTGQAGSWRSCPQQAEQRQRDVDGSTTAGMMVVFSTIWAAAWTACVCAAYIFLLQGNVGNKALCSCTAG